MDNGKLKYFNAFVDENNYIYSIDKVSISFSMDVGNNENLDSLLNDLKDLNKKYEYICTIFDNCAPRSSLGWTKHLLKYSGGFVVFIGYWSKKSKMDSDWSTLYYVRIEFNPNKNLVDNVNYSLSDDISSVYTNNTDLIRNVIKTIRYYCSKYEYKRCDFAIDIPTKIDYVILPQSLKRKQNYGTTKYFGSPGSHGRLKIYDKKTESCLDYDLTRVEYTFKANNKIKWENIMVIDKSKDILDIDLNITSNTETIVKLCMALKSAGLDYGEYLKNLNPRKRKEVIFSVEGFGKVLEPSEPVLNNLIFELSDYLNLSEFEKITPLVLDQDGYIDVENIENPFD